MKKTLIRNARLLGYEDLKNVLIEGEKFASIVNANNPEELQLYHNEIDINGKLIVPGFVDIHMHLDKAYTWPAIQNRSGTLTEAIINYEIALEQMNVSDLVRRMTTTVENSIRHGTTSIRTHLNYSNPNYMRKAVEAFNRVKDVYKNLIDLEAVLMLPFEIDFREEKEIRWAVENGIALLGGAPHLAQCPQKNLYKIFELATEMDVKIDLHIDESDDPSVKMLKDVCEWVIKEKYSHRIIAGHCTSISAMDENEAGELIYMVREANIGIVTLPSSNFYLQGRQDKGIIRRGLTRVKDFLKAGVPVAAASDNIQDPFHPYGKADMLQTALLTSYGAHMNSNKEVLKLIEMVTAIPAEFMELEKYGLDEGKKADFVIINCNDIESALSSQTAERETWKNGQSVCRVQEKIEWLHPENNRIY
ncbi:amidohydrolase family protein [Cytobacillus firmus]|uniref:amidohydrolase family protein n=1 Tax=Cytobacillus firmus TaxID=1399 RepID=UPI001C8D652B|nr:amidohydrolase family protein [Cytobacillus firmus]MBX9976594.1 amidohydrolase family protein [Cytobacillus firmus]